MKATFDSPCYFAYLSGCNDIKEGDEIHHEGFRMSWHPECDPEAKSTVSKAQNNRVSQGTKKRTEPVNER